MLKYYVLSIINLQFLSKVDALITLLTFKFYHEFHTIFLTNW